MKCPICGKPTEYKDNPTRPFCSERCKLIDFGHWADEDYSVPSEDSVDMLNEEVKHTPASDGNQRAQEF